MGAQDRGLGSVRSIEQIEYERQRAQALLDNNCAIEDRRKLGQYATPNPLAREIVKYGLSLTKSNEKIRFLEPAFGTGAFYSALLSETNIASIETATGYEIDSPVFEISKALWGDLINLQKCDFTRAPAKRESINLLITNPPYVRHHYIEQDEKERLKALVFSLTRSSVSGLSGLYCYFMLLAHPWLKKGAISGWLVPSEFMDVNYGSELKKYLLEKVRLLRIHRYNPNDLLFDDAMVSSAVVWFINEKPINDYEIEFSYGGNHESPEFSRIISKSVLQKEKKWTRFPNKPERAKTTVVPKIKDFFSVKRGIATGNNSFFIMTKEQADNYQLDHTFLQPILPSPRYLNIDKINADESGNPIIKPKYFLLNCQLYEEDVKSNYPFLWKYLSSGIENVASRYLCRSRKQWYFQEHRDPSPLLCTYMGRNRQGTGKPFRFILNRSRAIATNSYLMLYPSKTVDIELKKSPHLLESIWDYLNNISVDSLESEGRVYGGGLKKIEPKELGEVPCPGLDKLIFGESMDTYEQLTFVL